MRRTRVNEKEKGRFTVVVVVSMYSLQGSTQPGEIHVVGLLSDLLPSCADVVDTSNEPRGRKASGSSLWMDLPEDKRLFVGYTIGTSFCVVLTILALRSMVTQMGSDLVYTNHAFTDWCSKYEDSSLCRSRNDSHDIIPAPKHGHSVYQRLDSLELGYLRIQEKISEQDILIASMEERIKKLEKSHALSDTSAVELALKSLQHSSQSMSSRLDSELASITRELESIAERLHRVENHVFVSEDLQQS